MAKRKKKKTLILEDRSVVVLQEGPEWGLLQTQPTTRMLKFSVGVGRFGETTDKCLQLALPYVIFGYSQRACGYRLHLGFSDKPITSDSDLVYFPLFPNVQNGMDVCMDGHATPNRNGRSWAECCDTFWMKSFNMYGSLTGSRWPATTLLCDTFLRSYKKWSKMSLEKGSPDFMLDFDKLYQHIRKRMSPLKMREFSSRCHPKARL
jgi:hypothetical protein